MTMIWAFDVMEHNHDVYRGQNCMKAVYESLSETKMIILNFKNKKKRIPLTKEQDESYLNQTKCHIYKK